jgi:hypothetical protein
VKLLFMQFSPLFCYCFYLNPVWTFVPSHLFSVHFHLRYVLDIKIQLLYFLMFQSQVFRIGFWKNAKVSEPKIVRFSQICNARSVICGFYKMYHGDYLVVRPSLLGELDLFLYPREPRYERRSF